jgi:hypothetical protein
MKDGKLLDNNAHVPVLSLLLHHLSQNGLPIPWRKKDIGISHIMSKQYYDQPAI